MNVFVPRLNYNRFRRRNLSNTFEIVTIQAVMEQIQIRSRLCRAQSVTYYASCIIAFASTFTLPETGLVQCAFHRSSWGIVNWMVTIPHGIHIGKEPKKSSMRFFSVNAFGCRYISFYLFTIIHVTFIQII